MKDRIQNFIDYKGITPGDLAEILGVQRSNISHILNGRNKPGAVFIEKLLLAFPHVNARWLFTGEGTMIMGEDAERPEVKTEIVSPDLQEVKSEPVTTYKTRLMDSTPAEKNKNKTIEKIVLLYKDGTFQSYDAG